MFCPKCGHQQVGEERRFCSRCGFQLSVVTGLLSTNGILPGAEVPQMLQAPPAPPISGKKRGVRQGAKLMFLSMVITPIALLISIGIFDHPGFLIVPFTIFLAGIAWMVYSAIFGEDAVTTTPQPAAFRQPFIKPPQLHAPPAPLPVADSFERQRVPLPPPQRINTSEMVQPPSVTESTTKLFDKESQ